MTDQAPEPAFYPVTETRGFAIGALAAILIGGLLLVGPGALSAAQLVALIAAAVGGILLAHFILNGRRERGLALLGFADLLTLACLGVFANGALPAERGWPLILGAVGLAVIAAGLLAAPRDPGMLLGGFALLWAAGVAAAFTLEFLNLGLLPAVAKLWPVLLIIPAVALLRRVFRAAR